MESAMATVSSRIFKSGNSEAVRLPRDIAFGRDMEVTIVRSGDVLTIYPKRAPLSDLAARLNALPKPRDIETRDETPLPDRPGL
jgi:antitoxin VapB